jgi:hypothetical protein
MTQEILKNLAIFAAFVLMIFVVRARRKQHRQWLDETSDEWVCEHLADALKALKQEGRVVAKINQPHEDAPLEILVDPPFKPDELAKRVPLQDPVKISPRKVIYCEECGVEIGSLMN